MNQDDTNPLVASGFWLEWDGTRLAWNGDAAKSHCSEVHLCIDGVIFERIAATSVTARCERDFAYSPSARDEIEFSLRAADDSLIGTSWRVLHGRATPVGVHAWEGSPRAMQPMPAAPMPQWTDATTAIVVPIFNSPLLVQRCIAAVLRWTQGRARLILIDDASDDPGIAALLAEHEHREGIVVHRNPHNLGYTRSTNLGIELAGDADVVLLNSDTEVGPRWLDTLRQVGYSDKCIGTVTAVSDNAGAFSVPELEQSCPIPSRWTLPQAQRALLQNTGGCLPELPTGNGFCMFVKRAMLDRVGMLDAQAFSSGYGEENDLCQRAEHVGFRHVIGGNVFVHHERSASFGEARRAALGAQGMAVLRARYPDYEAKVDATLYSFARRVLDYRVRRIYADRDGVYATLPPRPRLLLTPRVAASAAALHTDYACFLLRHADEQGTLYRYTGSAWDLVETSSASEADNLRLWMLRYAIELVHIHDADALATALRRAATALGVPLIDSSRAADFVPVLSIPVENAAAFAESCQRLYRAARLANASFPEFKHVN